MRLSARRAFVTLALAGLSDDVLTANPVIASDFMPVLGFFYSLT
jgi:hypothetical protein